MNQAIIIAFAVSSVSFTISTTSVFTWFRNWVSNIHPKLEELIHCPYCLSHYVAVLFMLFEANHLPWYDWIIYTFAVIGMSACIHYILLRAYKPVAKAELWRKFEREEARKKALADMMAEDQKNGLYENNN